MRYRCAKCGRTVELPEGNYTCKDCGSPLRSESHEHHSNGIDPLQPLYQGLMDEVDSAIAKEKDVIDDYAELENKLREKGLTYDADIVNDIRNDEMDHLAEFQVIRDKLGLGPH